MTMRRGLGPLLLSVGLLAASPAHAGRDELLVAVAASIEGAMEEVVERYGEVYPATEIVLNAASSGVLLSQVEHGAPVDLFLSASPDEIDRLEAKGLLRTRRVVASGEIVVAVPKDASPPSDFADLAGARFGRIAVGNPSTSPVGRYAQQALSALGVWEAVESRLVFAADARQVLDWIARGEVGAGVVYSTDALAGSDRVLAGPVAPAGSHARILYEGAVLESAGNAQAALDLLEFLRSEAGREILARRGFLPTGVAARP
jgi:molybdate transport system substrate-binding protein